MDNRLHTIRRQFNRSATGSYDTHALVQRHMADWLATSLHKPTYESKASGPDVLEIGCGTGVLTEMLLHNWPLASLKAIDIAPAMLETALMRVRRTREAIAGSDAPLSDPPIAHPPHVCFLLADVETWAPGAQSASLDLIVSSACFQWLRHPKETLCYLRRLLRPGGLLAFTTFGPETFHELHESFNAVYRAAGFEPRRHGLSFQTTEQWQTMLNEAGFANIQVDRSAQVLSYASVKNFLHSIKAVGASTSEAAIPRDLGSRRLFTNMFKQYEDKFSIPGGVSATYDLLLIHASAP